MPGSASSAGADLLLRCRTCGEILDEDARFCDGCGTPVGEAGEPAAAARKVVTVLFADLTGSTALEERMDAESVRSVLDRFYAAMRAEVERHGGRVVKFTGDGAMAAFGVPEVHEDDAARAIDAALAMREELEELASDLGLDVSLKVGINTGEVVVSAADADVVGDSVNVASRLEGAASAGEILVGEETWRLTRGTSRYEPVLPLTLKGKSEPVPAYRLLSVDERTADSAAAPFVGREPELGRLIAAFEDAVESNSARLVTIIGSPGLGKTRLARELMSELSDTARVRETRCDPAGTTFAPIADAIREASGLSETDTEEQVLATLAGRLPEEDPDRERIAARAAAILGVGQPGSTEETFWAIRRLIEAAAAIQPVVLVLDDLHWAEPLLFDLIEHLAEWIDDAPVLLVGTGRPELRDKRPSLVEGGRASAVISLEGLDRRATAQLALNLLGAEELPAELLAKIPESTEGNPLFVRELVRMLVDDGVLLRTPDGWTVTVDVDAIQVPPTIQSLLSARVDRLRNDERTVVELASVVGKEFYRGAIFDLAPSGVKDLVDGCLESLRRKELVEPVGTYWIDEPVYRFHHVLIRDAAYRRVLKESRAELHQRVASWLEVKTAGVLGEHDELIGFHLEQAHEYKQQLGRPDNELGRSAAALLGNAARRALDYDDLPAAATLSGRALDCLPLDDPGRPDLLIVRCEALLSMGDVSQGALAVSGFESAADTPRLKAWATCFNGQLSNFNTPERLHETEALVASAAAELGELGDQAGAAKAHTVHASTLAGLGQFGECERVLDLALNAARGAEDRRRITATLGSAPHAALWGPNPVSRAGGRCLDIIRLLRITTGSKAVEVASLRCQAVLEAFRGRDEAARRMLGSAKRQLTELGLDLDLLETEQFLGIAELVARDFGAAESHLKAAHDGFLAAGVDSLAAQCAALLASAHLALGEYEAAELLALEAENLAGQDLKASIAWRAVKAELLARRGETDEAKRLAEAAIELAAPTDALIDHGNACRSLAVVLRAAGDADGARRAEERALALFERKGATALVADREQAETQAIPSLSGTAAPAAGLENRCSRVEDELLAMRDRGDYEGLAQLLAEDIEIDDRRPLFRMHEFGRSKHLAAVKVVDEIGAAVTQRVIAVRGESLCLTRLLFRTPTVGEPGFELDLLALFRIDAAGRVDLGVWFEPEDLDEALAELDERFASGEGAAHAAHIRRRAALISANNDRDWERMRLQFTPDATVLDRTPVGRGEMTVEDWIASVKELVDITNRLTTRNVKVHALSDHVMLTEVHHLGMSREGGEIDVSYHTLGTFNGGLIERIEMFNPDQLGFAQARFRELADKASSASANDCARVHQKWLDAFNARDFAAVATLCAPDIFYEHLRPLFAQRTVGRDEQVSTMRQVAYELAAKVSLTIEATRGQHLSLARQVWFSADETRVGWEYELLVVMEINDDGLITANVYFEPDDFDLALAELDKRFAVRTGRVETAVGPSTRALSNKCTRVLERLRAVFETQGWTTFSAIFADEFVGSDLRPGLQSEVLGPGGAVTYMRGIYEVGGIYMRVDPVAIRGERLAVARFTIRGEHDTFEVSVVCLYEVNESQRVTSWTVFESDKDEDALAALEERFAALEESDRRTRTLVNPAVEVSVRHNDCVARGEWDRLRDLYAEDSVWEDRRVGFGITLIGADARVENNKTIAAVGASRIETDPVAIRGDRLALCRVTLSASIDQTFAVEILALEEIDQTGRITRSVVFDSSDLEAAVGELDDRYITMVEPSLTGQVGLGADIVRSNNERDWVSYRRLFADDLTVSDHRPASLGEVHGADTYVSTMRALLDQTERYLALIVRDLVLEPNLSLTEWRNTGRTPDGVDIEIALYALSVTRRGRVARLELYSLEQLDRALARCKELSKPTHVPINAATRARDRVLARTASRDWEGVADAFTEDAAFDDRRIGLTWQLEGRDMWVDQIRQSNPDGTVVTEETIAIRGDRLVLSDVKGVMDGYEIGFQQIVELDDEGRIKGCTFFDQHNLEEAITELDERYLDGGDVPNVARLGMQLMHAYNDRDWDRIRSLAPNLTYVDTQPAGSGVVEGVENYITRARTIIELLPDQRSFLLGSHAESERCAVALCLGRGTAEHGGEIANRFLAVIVADGDELTRIETFAEDRLNFALARYQELADSRSMPDQERPAELAGPEIKHQNLAAQTTTRINDCVVRRDWETLETLLTEGSVFDDRRAGVSAKLVGPEAQLANFRAVAEVGADRIDTTVVATRGDRLALTRLLFVVGDGLPESVEVEIFFVMEVDAEGRMTGASALDPSDVDEAFDDLDERYATGEGAPYAELVNTVTDNIRALKARDWDRYRRALADDVVFIGHQPASLAETRGADALVETVKALVDMLVSSRMRIVSVLAIAKDRAVGELLASGTTAEGVEAEFPSYQLLQVRDGRIALIESFAPEDRDDALARFDELGRPLDRSMSLENAATRIMARDRDFEVRGDWGALAEDIADDAVTEDRRAGFGWRVEGKEQVVEHARVASTGVNIDIEVLAVRGDRLAVERQLVTSKGFEIEVLTLCELNDRGQIQFTAIFSPDAIDEAFAELEDRYFAGERVSIAHWKPVLVGAFSAIASRDWDRFASFFAEGLVSIDHRPESAGRIDGSRSLIDFVKSVAEASPSIQVIPAQIPTIETTLALLTIDIRGVDPDNPAGDRQHALYRLADGVVVWTEVFSEDRLADAMARFEEVLLSGGEVRALHNRATDVRYSSFEALDRGDREAFFSLVSPDCRLEDRRRGLSWEAVGHEALLEHQQAIHSLGVRAYHRECLATRGERLALDRRIARTGAVADSFEVEVLSLLELDDQDRLSAVVYFDPDDIDAATDELSERWLAGEASEFVEILRPGMRAIELINAQDWEALEDLYDQRFVFMDHRPISAAELRGPLPFIELIKGLADLVPDIRYEVVEVPRIRRDALVSRIAGHGTNSEGGRVDFTYLQVHQYVGDEQLRLERFDLDQFDEAVARFEELAGDASKTS